MSKETPAYIRGSELMTVQAAVNLWIWAYVVENRTELDSLPGRTTFYVYPKDLELNGPKQLNGKRVRVTFEVEAEPS